MSKQRPLSDPLKNRVFFEQLNNGSKASSRALGLALWNLIESQLGILTCVLSSCFFADTAQWIPLTQKTAGYLSLSS